MRTGDVVEAEGRRWRLGKALGAGGFGVVYQATDLASGASVAIKFAHTHSSDMDELLYITHNLRNEARYAKLLGKDAPQPIAIGATDTNRPFLVMELVPGKPLVDVAPARTKRERRSAVHKVVKLLEVLDRLHAAGVVHRDLKPDNVITTRAGVKLIDFGLARHAGETSKNPVGSMGYAPPEYRPVPGTHSVDPRNDVFSVGAILYERLSGTPPGYGQRNPCPSPGFPRLTGVPPHVADVVARALACEPKDRYPSARAMREDLEQAIQKELAAKR